MSGPPLPEPFNSTEIRSLNQADANTDDGTRGLPPFPPIPLPRPRFLEPGAYLINYTPVGGVAPWVTYDGTIRITSEGGTSAVSGDLYWRPPRLPAFPSGSVILPGFPPSTGNGVPIFTRDNYRYYLRITNTSVVAIFGRSITLNFEMWAYNTTTKDFGPNPEGKFSADMVFMTSPPNWPFPNAYLEGDVRNDSTGAVTARLKMGLVSKFLRKVTIEIDTVPGCGKPLKNVKSQTWQDLLGGVGFDVTVIESQTNVPEIATHDWSYEEMHAAMLQYRDRNDLDTEWRYYILCVSHIGPTPRGVMFDAGSTDSNNTPREGVGLAAKWKFPQASIDEPDWGEETGKIFDAAPDSYMRSAVHEIGHAFGLVHPSDDEPPQPMDRTFMCASNSIAAAATPALPFPKNTVWNHSPLNLRRLRHWPDVFIRPGGLTFGDAIQPRPIFTNSDMAIPNPDLELQLVPVASEVPFGAPVRLELGLKLADAAQTTKIQVPQDISLKSPFMSGTVKDPSGQIRTFTPLVRTVESSKMVGLTKDHPEVTTSLTLLRGGQGPLFPSIGVHEITATVSWSVGDGAKLVVQGTTSVLVTGIESASHAAAAHRILQEPDTHLVLALGGDHLKDGIRAIEQALEDTTLAPHYATIQAKRLAQPFMDPASGKVRQAAGGKAREVLKNASAGGECVCSKREKEKMQKLKVM